MKGAFGRSSIAANAAITSARLGLVLLSCLLVSCHAPAPHEPPKPTSELPALPPTPGGNAHTLQIDAAQSELRILVYRAGAMAAFGHNHVIINRSLGGWVQEGAHANGDKLYLTIPVAGFVVDDAAARREEGADFADEVSEEAKAGTMRNMQGALLLDAEHYPTITLRSVEVSDTGGGLAARMTVNVAGRESSLLVPFSLEAAPGRLTAQGSVQLRQSELGLTPFSALLGALKVQDEMRLKFTLVAATR